MYNIILKVEDETLVKALCPNVRHDATCRGFHGSIVHP
jgi:hypothetical protein